MKTTGENIDRDIERGLKDLAKRRVPVPRDFRASVLRQIARSTGAPLPRAARPGLWRRVAELLERPLWMPLASGAAALAFVLITAGNPDSSKGGTPLQTQSAALPVNDTRDSIANVGVPDKVESGLAESVQDLPSAPAAELASSVEGQAGPSEKRAAESKPVPGGLLAMPGRLPHSLRPLQEGAPASAGSAAAPALASAANEPIRIIVTPEPTPMAHGLRGFSEARRNVFKPGQGEYVAVLFGLDSEDHVTISVYDLNGRAIATLIEESRPKGVHEVRWTGHNGRGELAGSGKYVIVVRARDSRQLARHKVALIR